MEGAAWLMRVAAVLIGAIVLGGCGPLTFTVGYEPDAHELDATVVERDAGRTDDRIAIIDVSGLIINSRQSGILQERANPVATLHEKLEKARRNRDIKAVILRINSPGGAVTASDAMYRLVKRFKARSGKPVVMLMMDVAASGGYYLACAGDHMVAYPTTITGSIGVIMQTVSVKPALESIGIRPRAFTSGPSKDAGSPLSELTEEHQRILQGMVDDFYARFLAVVKQARPQVENEQWKTLADGRVFTGDQALAAGLVDEVGDLYDAWTKAKSLAGVKQADLVLLHRSARRVASPFAHQGLAPGERGTGVQTQINLAQINLDDTLMLNGGGFYYLWMPDVP